MAEPKVVVIAESTTRFLDNLLELEDLGATELRAWPAGVSLGSAAGEFRGKPLPRLIRLNARAALAFRFHRH
jgi:hypothetical protein